MNRVLPVGCGQQYSIITIALERTQENNHDLNGNCNTTARIVMIVPSDGLDLTDGYRTKLFTESPGRYDSVSFSLQKVVGCSGAIGPCTATAAVAGH